MRLLLVVFLLLVALVLLVSFYVVRRIKRLAGSPHTRDLLDSFDQGLAIPMRDCDPPAGRADTRTTRKEPDE